MWEEVWLWWKQEKSGPPGGSHRSPQSCVVLKRQARPPKLWPEATSIPGVKPGASQPPRITLGNGELQSQGCCPQASERTPGAEAREESS